MKTWYRSRGSRFEVEPHACAVGCRLRIERQPMTPDTAENGGCELVGVGKRVERESREILGRRGGLRKRHFGARVEEVWFEARPMLKRREGGRRRTTAGPRQSQHPLFHWCCSGSRRERRPALPFSHRRRRRRRWANSTLGSHTSSSCHLHQPGADLCRKLKFRYFQETSRNNIA